MMDSYLTNFHGPDSLSLQEMLDIDIKTEKDIDDIFNNDSNLNFHELPPLNLDEDSLGAPGENNVWLTSSNDGSSLLGGDVSNGISSDLNIGENRMVSPNSVVPVTLIQVPHDKVHIKIEKNVSKVNGINRLKLKPFAAVERLSAYSNVVIKEELDIEDDDDELDGDEEDEDDDNNDAEEFARSIIMKNNYARAQLKVQHESQARAMTNGTKRNISVKTVNAKNRRIQEYNSDNDLNLTSSAYPKPAYSYSCLIAMALKNSPSGSLPVSEIYNFMCEHFPYFKTAPNGWKNSVRHNLSLNKCFEKIEKPATNGSQRKGCLWAMNPNKINKMDEEVQKWSKKDKLGIYKSMINPDSLDALERGQLSGVMQNSSEAESDDDAWDNRRSTWATLKQEVVEEEELEEEEEEDDGMSWLKNGVSSRLSPQHILAAINTNDDECDSDASLTEFDIEVAESMCHNVRVASSPNGAFQPLLSGAYTVNSQRTSVSSPKRFKTIGGNTITGNYVYKPLGSSNMRRKSPLRHSLLASLEADD